MTTNKTQLSPNVLDNPAIGPDAKREDGPAASAIDALLDTLCRTESPPTFPVVIGLHCLEFRYPESITEIRDAEKAMATFVVGMQKGQREKNLPQAFAEAIGEKPMKPIDLATAHTIAYWSAPGQVISQPKALLFVRKQPTLATLVMQRIDDEMRQGQILLNLGGLEESKKKLKLISGGASGSKDASSGSRADTRTTSRKRKTSSSRTS